MTIIKNANIMTPCSCQVLCYPLYLLALYCVSPASQRKLEPEGNREAKNSHFSVEETEAQRRKVSP